MGWKGNFRRVKSRGRGEPKVRDRNWEMEGERKRKSSVSKFLWKKLRLWGGDPEEGSGPEEGQFRVSSYF